MLICFHANAFDPNVISRGKKNKKIRAGCGKINNIASNPEGILPDKQRDFRMRCS